MQNGRYLTVKLAPGKHTFRSNDKQSGVEVDLKPGQEYFLRVELVTGVMKGHGRVVAVVPEQARFELKAKNLKPLDADKITDKERVSIEQVAFGEEEKASK
jgi:predicted methyltransferase